MLQLAHQDYRLRIAYRAGPYHRSPTPTVHYLLHHRLPRFEPISRVTNATLTAPTGFPILLTCAHHLQPMDHYWTFLVCVYARLADMETNPLRDVGSWCSSPPSASSPTPSRPCVLHKLHLPYQQLFLPLLSTLDPVFPSCL